MLEDNFTQQSDGHTECGGHDEDRTELLRQALITQARVITELQHEVRRLRMVEELLENQC